MCHGDSRTGAKGGFVQDDPKEIASPGMECALFVCLPIQQAFPLLLVKVSQFSWGTTPTPFGARCLAGVDPTPQL